MVWPFILGLLVLPVLEILIWIKSSELIGFWSTLGLAILAVLAGTAILRRQGLAMLLDARARMEQGEAPVQAAFDGLCLAAAGFLLVLPGFITDALALILLLPPVRSLLRGWVTARLVVLHPQPGPSGPVTIDGEYVVVDGDDTKRLEP